MTTQVAPSLRGDVIGGITTFLTMSYIVVVNPSILGAPETGMPFDGVLGATVLVAASMTLLMGLYARLPFGVAPGMGLNAFLAYTVIVQRQVPWQIALGCVFWAGVLFLVLSLSPVRERIATAIPPGLRLGAAAGIGLLLTLIGLRNAGVIAADPVTIVRAGTLDHRVVLVLLGILIAVALGRRNNPLAFVASIVTVAGAAWALGYARAPAQLVSLPNIGAVFLKLDPIGALQLTLVPTMVAIAMTDLFDSLSTFMGVAAASGLTGHDGRPQRLRQGLIVDAWATLSASLFGSSPGTAYVESTAGIRMGARTGRAAVVTALCFVPCYFLAPLAGAIPSYATAAVLLMVGVAMFQTIQHINFASVEDGLPAFLTLTIIPLTLSITQGLLWGFVVHTLLYAVVGRAKELSPTLLVLASGSAAMLILEQVL